MHNAVESHIHKSLSITHIPSHWTLDIYLEHARLQPHFSPQQLSDKCWSWELMHSCRMYDRWTPWWDPEEVQLLKGQGLISLKDSLSQTQLLLPRACLEPSQELYFCESEIIMHFAGDILERLSVWRFGLFNFLWDYTITIILLPHLQHLPFYFF